MRKVIAMLFTVLLVTSSNSIVKFESGSQEQLVRGEKPRDTYIEMQAIADKRAIEKLMGRMPKAKPIITRRYEKSHIQTRS